MKTGNGVGTVLNGVNVDKSRLRLSFLGKLRSLKFTLVTARINNYGLTVHSQYIPKPSNIHDTPVLLYSFNDTAYMLGVCGVQGIVGLGSHGMRTRCHLLTFMFYLFQ